MWQLYDKHFPVGWARKVQSPEIWQAIHEVDSGELWETHNSLKNSLLTFARRRLSRQARRRGESDAAIEAARNALDPNILTIGFGRRFATYKRANLLFSEVERIADLLCDEKRPVQLIYAGKAHPKNPANASSAKSPTSVTTHASPVASLSSRITTSTSADT
jgi:starch phosphorylase